MRLVARGRATCGHSSPPNSKVFLALIIINTLQASRYSAVGCEAIHETATIAAGRWGSPQPISEETGELKSMALVHSDSLSSLFREPAECAVFAEYGPNYLTPIDVLVKASDSDTACIKARFSLSIKVEEAQFVNSRTGEVADWKINNETNRPILGYVPLEHVISVEETCPEAKAKSPQTQTDTTKGKGGDLIDGDRPANDTKDTNKDGNGRSANDKDKKQGDGEEDENELEMIVTFDCGKLSFTFRRDEEKVYVSAIKGMVKLDQKVIRQFQVSRPMFLTHDLDHRFKYDDSIEIVSEVQSKSHILTANFYQTEFEAFRKTTSRDFLKPPDGKSRPFLDEDLKTA